MQTRKPFTLRARFQPTGDQRKVKPPSLGDRVRRFHTTQNRSPKDGRLERRVRAIGRWFSRPGPASAVGAPAAIGISRRRYAKLLSIGSGPCDQASADDTAGIEVRSELLFGLLRKFFVS